MATAFNSENEKDHSGTSLTEGDGVSVSVPTSTAPHDAPTIWALWMLFKKDGSPSLGTFGRRERRVVIIPMETWNALCAEIPALQTKQFNVGSYE